MLGLDCRPPTLEDVKNGKTRVPYKIVYRDLLRPDGYRRGVELTDIKTDRKHSMAVGEDPDFYTVEPGESVIFYGKNFKGTQSWISR